MSQTREKKVKDKDSRVGSILENTAYTMWFYFVGCNG